MRRISPSTRVHTRALLAAGALALATTVASAAPASAGGGGPAGCGYGTGGPFADTLCWIDMAGFVDGEVREVSLPGGYTVTFTIDISGTRGIVASPFPTWEGATVGNDIYTSTPGQPALYQVVGQGAGESTISLTGIEVTDSGGNTVQGWRVVGVDAEGTFENESITFTADTPVSPLAEFAPSPDSNGCQVNVTQVDPNTVQCTGGSTGPDYGTLLVGATEPTTFTQTMTVSTGVSREGVAFAFQSSTISLAAAVTGRVAPGDSFDVSVVSPESLVVGEDGTGSADTASTGDLIVLPRVDGGAYTLQEVGGSGTDLAAYDIAWACTRDGVADPSLSATGVASIEVSPAAGEAIACTVTNSVAGAPPSPTPGPGPGELPRTGTNHDLPLGLLGGTLVALGAAATQVARRRLANAR